jgi:hypothetical protein
VGKLAAVAALMAGLQAGEEGFTPLFNGKDLDGWKFHLKKKDHDPSTTFKVEGGTVVCTGKPYGYMYTEGSYLNFTLRFDWRYKKPEGLEDESKFKGNSGYLLFVTQHDEVLGVWPTSLECQGMFADVGTIIPIGKKSAKFTYDREARNKAVKPLGEWNSYEIAAKDGTVTISINGTEVTKVTEHAYAAKGSIGFQSEGAEIHWKNIRIKEEK